MIKVFDKKDHSEVIINHPKDRPVNSVSRIVLLARGHPVATEFIVAPLMMVFLFLLSFGQFFNGSYSTATFLDNTHLFLPIFNYMSNSLTHGDFPYWINTMVGGLPLYTSPQFSAFYPFYFLQFGLFARPLDGIFQLHYLVFLHFFIMYVNSYIMLRLLRLRWAAALLGASIFVFSPNIYDYRSWVNIIAPYSWFPLLVGAIFLILENKRSRLGILLGILAFSLLTLASPAQPFIHALYVCGFLYICKAIDLLRQREIKSLLKVTRNLKQTFYFTLSQQVYGFANI